MTFLLLVLLAPVSAWTQDSASCEGPSQYAVGSNVQSTTVRVRQIEGKVDDVQGFTS